ncbi:chemotaxis protein CheW [Geoalkalibacter halelectricus]|uniref:Chemotaxis protein CheW n=1 Tax=Geoalkalibacter halelectricus TaxID=2847045 RepID=A0ABY5ZMI6_9BACT|nr:chemotaxis protein CheW [Geoalkalibacter halelectricus]MDO3378339.1 chemotaxis protein CheW [Geoalkalibacter halelectricus]UWZ80341.1 chemotaxis protein CheW [Geoalkalibacter halelectricus]
MAETRQDMQDIRAALTVVREDYWRGLEQDEAAESRARHDVLVVRLGPDWFGLPCGGVREVLRVPPLVRVPGAAAHIAGIISVRGEILPVTDLRPVFKLAAAAPARSARLVVMAAGDLKSALLVDEVRELRAVEEAAIEAPGEAEGLRSPLVSGRVACAEGLLTLLDTAQVLALAEQSGQEG